MDTMKYAIQSCTSSLSFISSLTIAGMICTSPRKLTSPYRRIIFGLSIADIVQSLAILTGPFAIPKGTMAAPWAVGSVTTCNINGFMATNLSVPLYTASLCIYYVYNLVRKMPDEEFARRLEWFIHIGIFIYNIAVTSAAYALQTYNASPTNCFCFYAAYPTGCNIPGSPNYGQCTRGKHLTFFTVLGPVLAPSVGFIIIVICGIRLRCHAVQKTRQFRVIMEGARDRVHEDRLQNQVLLSSLYQRETIMQASLYVAIYLLTYLLPGFSVLDILMETNDGLSTSKVLQFLGALTFPLGGFFNILIYCRPKVNALRRRENTMSWIVAFLRVIRAGGEIPEEDSAVCCCFSSVLQENDRHDRTEITTNFRQPNQFVSDVQGVSNAGTLGRSEYVAFQVSEDWKNTLQYCIEPESLVDLLYARTIELHDDQPVSSLKLTSGLSIEQENSDIMGTTPLRSKSLQSNCLDSAMGLDDDVAP